MFRILVSTVVLLTLVGVHPRLADAQTTSARAAATSAGPVSVNLNAATATELEALPGVGPKTAARIIEYRQKNGPFKKIEELMNVPGVGEKNFLKLKGQITIASAKAEHARQ